MRLVMASRIQAREELTVFSQSARRRRYFISHAKVRSTTQRRKCCLTSPAGGMPA